MNTQQSKALRLADKLRNEYCDAMAFDAAKELRRLHQVDLAYREWLDKTEWVQASIQAKELGQHRADVIKQRLDLVTGQRDELLEALKAITDAADKKRVTAEHYEVARAAIAKVEGGAA